MAMNRAQKNTVSPLSPLIKAKERQSAILLNTFPRTLTAMALSMTLTAVLYRKQLNGWKLGHRLGVFDNSSKSEVSLSVSGVNCAESAVPLKAFWSKPNRQSIKANGGKFIQLMGGATAKRKDNPIKLMKIDSKEPGKYGDPIGQKICGVQTNTIQLATRLHQWHIERLL